MRAAILTSIVLSASTVSCTSILGGFDYSGAGGSTASSSSGSTSSGASGCETDADCGSGNFCYAATGSTTKSCHTDQCSDGLKDGDETGVDCGGTCPTMCGTGLGCSTDADCVSGDGCSTKNDATAHTCVNACADGHKDGTETDVDCGGGTCPACMSGGHCSADGDCPTGDGCSTKGDATMGTCVATCVDGHKDGTETGVDCGGSCATECAVGTACTTDADCASGDGCSTKSDATMGTCVAACSDGHKDGTETDTDCGGTCSGCPVGDVCATTSDCASGLGCDKTNHVCDATTCSDGVKDGSETDTDCGGSCPPCGNTEHCSVDGDCISGDGCSTSGSTVGTCVATCSDGHKDGNEVGVDCGGSCPACPTGSPCGMDSDCAAGDGCSTAGSTAGTCVPQCADGHKDGKETDVDCGGGTCAGCGWGLACAAGTDCVTGYCCGMSDCGSLGSAANTCGAYTSTETTVVGLAGDDTQSVYYWYQVASADYQYDGGGKSGGSHWATDDQMVNGIATNGTTAFTILTNTATSVTSLFNTNPYFATSNLGTVTAPEDYSTITINHVNATNNNLLFWTDGAHIYGGDTNKSPFAQQTLTSAAANDAFFGTLVTEGTTLFYGNKIHLVTTPFLIGLPYGSDLSASTTYGVGGGTNGSIAVNATTLFWCDNTDIVSVPLASAPLGNGGTVLIPGQVATGLAVTATHIYWTTNNGTTGTVMRANLDGTDVVTLAPTTLANGPIHLTGSRAYWVNSDTTYSWVLN